jgi:4'-phosphopantetheinyl transferase
VRATASSVHIWRVDLAAIGDQPRQLLSREELARAARIVPARKRVLWARSRGVLRALLGRYLERDPRALRFELGGGKPVLAHEGPVPSADLRFNISHSGDLALVAVSAGREVGVDIERARERYTAEFLHDWVAREAVFKCRGDNPAADLWTAELDVGPAGYAAVAVEDGPCELHSWDWRA